MLFNSYVFIFGFLPITIAVFYMIGATRRPAVAMAWLLGASLVFYGWWNPIYLSLIIGSVCVNYALGQLLIAARRAGRPGRRSALLAMGIVANVLIIGYFKYANFFLDKLNALYDTGLGLEAIALPLGISFFTFQQIAYLLDCHRGQARSTGLLSYGLFVTFFPQLIAGPIIYEKEVVPQFASRSFGIFSTRHLAVGLAIFTIGLMKKVVIADRVAAYANPVFDAAAAGTAPGLLEAWIAAFAYTFQLYFDFSGYSDMALGLARMFGILLPVNFNSPFKASGIIEFWKRWHMTLTRFINAYLFTPIAVRFARHASASTYPSWLVLTLRVHLPLLITFGLVGLWHGAGWTYVVFGLTHGVYLVVNHAWRAWRPASARRHARWSQLTRALSTALTFVAVVVAFVPFRASSLSAAALVLEGMVGANGVLLPEGYIAIVNQLGVAGGRLLEPFIQFGQFPVPLRPAVVELTLLLLAVWLLPNTQEIMARYRPALTRQPRGRRRWWQWRLTPAHAVGIAAVGVIALLHLSRVTEFLYFQF